jgi:hypothetical protein
MSWQMAVVGALGGMQYKAQGKIGRYNQSVADRNARVLEGQAKQLEQKADFDIAQFTKTFKKIEGETTVALAKSGVQVGSGSSYYIELSNALEAELQKDVIKYNSQVAAANKMEEANFARISGVIARNEAKMAQIGTIASTGTSLLSMSQGSFGTKSYNQGAGSSKRYFTSNSAYR